MKILMCSTRMGIGGAETHVLTLARELTRMGHSVTVMSSGGSYVAALTRAGAAHVTVPLDRRDPLSVLRARRAIRKEAIGGGFDVVHAHGRIPSYICGTLARESAFPPLGVTAHGLYPSDTLVSRLSVWGRRTVAVSEEVRNYTSSVYHVPRERIDVIPNGVDTDLPPHVPSENLRVVCACRLDRDTVGTPLLLCSLAARLRRDFPALAPTFMIVGSGSMLSAVRDAARRANTEYRGLVTVAGAVTDMASLLSRTDVFVGSSRAALEAMAVSCPVVLASDVGCAGVLDERVIPRAEKNNYTCRGEAPNCEETLRAGLERILGMSNDERAAIGALGRETVLRLHSSSLVAGRTLDFYRRLLVAEKPGVMLCGYFGAGNTGDDATLDAMLGMIKSDMPDAHVSVIARRGMTERAGVHRIGRFNLAGIIRTMRTSRLFVLAGGSLLQNATSNRSLFYYTHLLALARKNGARTALLGGGVGPVVGAAGTRRTLQAVENCDSVSLRDPGSRSYLAALGADVSGMTVSADPAILTPPLPLPRLPGLIWREGAPDGNGNGKGIAKEIGNGSRSKKGNNSAKGYFAVSLRRIQGLRLGDGRKINPKHEETVMATLIDAATRIADGCGLTPLWLPLAPGDVSLCRAACRRAGKGTVLPVLAPGETVSLLSRCAFALGMRLHMSVLASCAGLPAVGVAYDPKVGSFALFAGQPQALDISSPDFSADTVVAAVDDLLKRREALRAEIISRTSALRSAARASSRELALLSGFYEPDKKR